MWGFFLFCSGLSFTEILKYEERFCSSQEGIRYLCRISERKMEGKLYISKALGYSFGRLKTQFQAIVLSQEILSLCWLCVRQCSNRYLVLRWAAFSFSRDVEYTYKKHFTGLITENLTTQKKKKKKENISNQIIDLWYVGKDSGHSQKVILIQALLPNVFQNYFFLMLPRNLRKNSHREKHYFEGLGH